MSQSITEEMKVFLMEQRVSDTMIAMQATCDGRRVRERVEILHCHKLGIYITGAFY